MRFAIFAGLFLVADALSGGFAETRRTACMWASLLLAALDLAELAWRVTRR